MKNIVTLSKKGILAVLLFCSFISFGNEVSFSKAKADDKKTEVILTDVEIGDALSIKDAYGVLLYTENIKKAGNYIKAFDFTSLPKGTYVFELESDTEIKTIPFTVNLNSVLFEKNKKITNFKPHITQKGDLLFVSKLAQNFEKVNISVYLDNANEYKLLHTESVEDKQTVERIYKLEKGNYKIVINSNNKEFTKFINN